MALTDTAIRNAKPRDRDYKLADSGGLYLLMTPAGGKLWRLKYRSDGVERKLSLGRYPAVTLATPARTATLPTPGRKAGTILPLPSVAGGSLQSCRPERRSVLSRWRI
jgi:hypothetical protein